MNVYIFCAKQSILHLLCKMNVYIFCAEQSVLYVLCKMNVYIFCAEQSVLYVLCKMNVYIFCGTQSVLYVLDKNEYVTKHCMLRVILKNMMQHILGFFFECNSKKIHSKKTFTCSKLRTMTPKN